MWFKYGLKAQKLLAQGCYGHKQYALSTGVWGLLAKLEFYNLIIIQN